jgi:hypothetical protein
MAKSSDMSIFDEFKKLEAKLDVLLSEMKRASDESRAWREEAQHRFRRVDGTAERNVVAFPRSKRPD